MATMKPPQGVSIDSPPSPVPDYSPKPPTPAKDMAYGGGPVSSGTAVQTGQIYRLERGYPAFRRGRLLQAIPRTKAETLYVADNSQALVNPILNKAAPGTATSGAATPGTSDAPNVTTRAVVRYRTPYKTILQ